jgi:hypothetical protein
MNPYDVKRWNRFCRLAALVWILALTVSYRTYWPQDQDSGQYYMGGLVARLGEWNALYPIPHPGNPYNAGGRVGSSMNPEYRRLAFAQGVGDANRFIQPPPIALAFVPLSGLPFRDAQWIWFLLMALCCWGVAVQAGRFFELALGHPSRTSGVLTILVATSPLVYRVIFLGQISPLVALLLGAAVLGLLKDRTLGIAATLASATLMKYVGLSLLPLLIAMSRWREVVWLGAMLCSVMLMAVGVMGSAPFRVFVNDIAPTLGRSDVWPGNQALSAFLLRSTGQEGLVLPPGLELGVRVLQGAVLLVIGVLVFRRGRAFWSEPPNVFAGAAALLLWTLIFSPLFWEHYFIYLCPFWGWLAWETRHTRARLLMVILAIGLGWAPYAVFLRSYLGEPLTSHMLWSSMITLGLACRRLTQAVPVAGYAPRGRMLPGTPR